MARMMVAILLCIVVPASAEECDAAAMLQAQVQKHDHDVIVEDKEDNQLWQGVEGLDRQEASGNLSGNIDAALQVLRQVKKLEATLDLPSYGNPGCPCIGIDKLEGNTTATLKDGKEVSYPADLGARCEAWDATKHPKCRGTSGASWCKKKWCYVDPCKCKDVSALPKVSIYIKGAQYQGKPLHFSYATCGEKDLYSAEEEKKTAKDIEKTCSVHVDSSEWGAENCRCIGINPQPGLNKVLVKGLKKLDFQAAYGASCHAWDKKNHPDCKGAKPPSWCNQAWCYVEPCSCKVATPPKTSSGLPDAMFQGKPIYYSYATCGGTDTYTAGVKKACVNQNTSGDCGKLNKCAWNGKECLGKELVSVCKSGAWNPKAIIALALPLLSFVY